MESHFEGESSTPTAETAKISFSCGLDKYECSPNAVCVWTFYIKSIYFSLLKTLEH